MERTLTNIADFSNSVEIEETRTLSYSEELEKINKIKYGLSVVYFIGFAIFTSALFL